MHSLSRLSDLTTRPRGIRVRRDGAWMGLVRSEARIDVGAAEDMCGGAGAWTHQGISGFGPELRQPRGVSVGLCWAAQTSRSLG